MNDIRASHYSDGHFVGAGVRWFCDGMEVPHVTDFDIDEGWIDARCDGCENGGPGKHMNADRTAACDAPRRYGRIHYVFPDDRVVS